MPFDSTVNAPTAYSAATQTPFLRRAIPLAIAAGLGVTLASSVPRGVTADDDGRGHTCSNATLRGDYGILISGTAPAGAGGQTELVVGTALRTYDGNGAFTQIDNVHGQLTGTVRDRLGTGTYEVNADCTGTTTLVLPGIPVPVVTSIVIVDHGREVKEAVMSPPPALVTAAQRRK
jgi:hypothetical protein